MKESYHKFLRDRNALTVFVIFPIMSIIVAIGLLFLLPLHYCDDIKEVYAGCDIKNRWADAIDEIKGWRTKWKV